MFSSMVNKAKAAIQQLQGSDRDAHPTTVYPIGSNDMTHVHVQARHHGLVLYGPRERGRGQASEPSSHEDHDADADVDSFPDIVYELVANSEKTSFSLQRFLDLKEAQETFNSFRETLSVLLELDSSFCNQQSLQQFSDYLRSNPSASLAHLAVFFDLKTVAAKDEVLEHLNDADQNGCTPLMLAVQKENVFMVRLLVGKDAALDLVDVKGNSVFHHAALTNKGLIELLGSNPPGNVINECNEEGNTPLHIACKNDKPDCVQALLIEGADVNVAGTLDHDSPFYSALKSSSASCAKEILQMYPKQLHTHDIKHGGTPLHWAKSKELVEALVEFGCLVNAKNFIGKTALHVMVEHQRLDCVLALASFKADLDLPDADGNTALQLAVESGDVSCVKALLALNCDIKAVNKEGLTAWTLAEKKMKESGIMDFKDREGVLYAMYAVGANGHSIPCDKGGKEMDFSKLRQASFSTQYRRVRCLFDEMLAKKARKVKVQGQDKQDHEQARLLSLDGGGIKGLAICRMLMSMEDVMERPIIHCFDWVIGTSTGGILALALATGKSVRDCLNVYLRLKDKVFVGTRPYNTKVLETFLQAELGLTTKMGDIAEPKIMVTTTVGDRTPPDMQLIRNYTSPQDMLGIGDFDNPDITPASVTPDFLVWRAAKATGAAPSFFRPEGRYLDGGILANNPSLYLLAEIAEYNMVKRALDHDDEVVKPSVLVSLGTGVAPVKKTKVVDIFRPDSAQDTFKLFMNWDGMGKLMLDSVLDGDSRVVDQTKAWCLSLGVPFHRLSPSTNTFIEMDETDDKVLVDLLWTTMAYMHYRKAELRELKQQLTKSSCRK